MFLDYIKQIQRDGGFLYTIMRALHSHVSRRLFHARRFLILARELNDSSRHMKAEAAEARAATRDDLDLLSQCGYPQFVLNQWFEQGAHAWLIEREGKLLSCYWLDGSDFYALYNWLVIQSTPQEASILWWWVNHNNRKQGLGDQVRRLGISEYACAGFTHILSAVNVLNHNAIERCNKLGLKMMGHLFVLRILGITLVRFGRSWHIGRWSANSTLNLSIETLRR